MYMSGHHDNSVMCCIITHSPHYIQCRATTDLKIFIYQKSLTLINQLVFN